MCTLSKCFHPWPPSLLLQPPSEWSDNWFCCVGETRPGSSPRHSFMGQSHCASLGHRCGAWRCNHSLADGAHASTLPTPSNERSASCFVMLGCFPFPCLLSGPALRVFMKIKGELELEKPLPAEQLVLCSPHTALLPRAQFCLLVYPAHQAPENIWVWDPLFQTLVLLDGEECPALWENHCFKKFILVITM